ncbi:MAG: hypothetical protein PHF74_02235 [Dehalococcoidales bacterium]|nr:hypothetical protein [Dehalococcoidales bacterium]
MEAICKLLDKIRTPFVFEKIWHLLTSVSTLNPSELSAASSVLGANAINYDKVRVAEGRILSLIFKFNRDRAFTLFHTVNFPKKSGYSRTELDIVVHELVHVLQFEKIGSLYIPQALRAQMKEGYDYGGWQQLEQDWVSGKHFRDFNREQQGQIAQDYYNIVISAALPHDNPVSLAYQPFIDELSNGDL